MKHTAGKPLFNPEHTQRVRKRIRVARGKAKWMRHELDTLIDMRNPFSSSPLQNKKPQR